MKRIGGLALVILGLALAAFGIFRATTAEDSTVVGVSVPGGESQFVYTAPGVLSLVDDAVTVTLSAPEGTVQWALAPTQDAELYIGDAPATKVVGLETWEEATWETIPGTDEAREIIAAAAAAESGFDITQSDLWLESGSGEGSVKVELTPDPTYEQSLIATTSTGAAPELTLEWNRALATTNPVPVIVIGILVALIGALLELNYRQDRLANEQAERRHRERHERSEAETSILPKVDEREEAKDTGTYGAAILPAANLDLRNRELSEEDRLVIPAAEAGDGPEEAPAEDEPGKDVRAEDGRAEDGPSVGAEPAHDVVDSDIADIPAAVDAQGASDDNADEIAPSANDDENEESADKKDEQDWRSLWNFSWGTPYKKGDDDA